MNMPNEPSAQPAPLTVCVTGASGFIASHVVRELLERGHRVRATLRDPADTNKTAHLWAIAEAAGGVDRLETYAADLMQAGSFDGAVQGCDVVCHMAAAVILQAADPQRDIVDPSVQGCGNVLGAVARSGTVRKVVHTSSVAAILRYADAPRHTFTEDDWNTESTLATNPYGVAKTEAERAMWRAHAGQTGAEASWQLVTLNPVVVFGPPYTKAHCKGSNLTLRELISGVYPAAPPIHLGLVDVRDVAKAHAEAVERDDASGRHILCAEGRWMGEIAKVLRREFPDYKVPRFTLPAAAMYGMSLFSGRLSFAMARRLVNNPVRVDAGRSKSALGLQYRPVDESIRDAVRVMVEGGLVRPRRKG